MSIWYLKKHCETVEEYLRLSARHNTKDRGKMQIGDADLLKGLL